ncbi:MAG: hypothetical protein LIP03_08830 [Bacteroidales bacterium]|nr:hypothetical protein [Bacteroidales bacterium]
MDSKNAKTYNLARVYRGWAIECPPLFEEEDTYDYELELFTPAGLKRFIELEGLIEVPAPDDFKYRRLSGGVYLIHDPNRPKDKISKFECAAYYFFLDDLMMGPEEESLQAIEK